MTQKQIILKYLRSVDDWVPSYRLQKAQLPDGWVGTEGRRRALELVDEGLLEKKMEGKYVWFRAAQPKEVKQYVVHFPEGDQIIEQPIYG